ncbi:MAG: hypothetical protein HYV07_02325 [Deltaproteobacteria bacterium]|nr:hypothetical protein [Deltaproteobacteria bacterium]
MNISRRFDMNPVLPRRHCSEPSSPRGLGLAAVPLAAAVLLTGCATTGTSASSELDELVPVESLTTNRSSGPEVLNHLSKRERETYRDLGIALGAALGTSGNPNAAISVRVLSIFGFGTPR